MKFGIFDHFEGRDEPAAQRYEHRLQMIEAADAAGFWCYHKAEHHFTVLDMAPSANLLFSAAFQRTDQIRLGSLVYLLPMYDPVRLAEEICVLDHMSGGRLEVGVGKGISPVEHRLWGNDPDLARERFEEQFTLLRAALAGDCLTYASETRSVDGAPMILRPAQPDGPGFWYPGNVGYAGAHRLNTIVGGPPQVVAAAHDAFRAQLVSAESDWNPGVVEPCLGATMHVYCAPTDERALARVRDAFPRYHRNLVSLWEACNEPLTGGGPSLGGDVDLALKANALVAGSPDTVASHVAALRDEAEVDYVVSAFAWGDLTHEEVLDSLGLYVSEVMPRFS